MERNPVMLAAEEAIAWAKQPDIANPMFTNYNVLRLDALRAAHATDPGEPIVHHVHGVSMAHWACLSRLLIMDEPELGERIHPHLDPVLDCQAGTTWLQLQFADVTGRRPTIRSWRHARGAVER